ncbi:nose resistant to fluoxetine protein 6-like [Diadema setosum]|uniref:nose resistant to fluoxetine protein 6-like n=1 Tax=Diadema setosum TaxID=31175 RepID=UPI003B3A42C7
MKASDGKISWIRFYLHRHFRLTPVLAMVILIWMFIVPEMNQGPIWYHQEEFTRKCRHYYWSYILYINNFISSVDCVPGTWYLACDMQFYYLSPLLLIPLYKFPKIGLGAITATGIASFITTAAIVWKNNIGLELHSFDDAFPDGNHTSSPGNNGDYFSVVYDKPYCRISPYLLGMMLAYLMQRIGRRTLVLNSVTE